MSNRAVGSVWRSSTAKGSELLVLLAIADWADDEGRNSWGGVVRIAEKTRLTERGVRDVLRRLVGMGELVIEPNSDRRQVKNGYRPRSFMHVCCAAEPEKIAASDDDANRKSLPDKPEKIAGCTTGKDFRADRKLTRTKPEDGRTAIRKIRQGSVSTHTPRARDGRRPHPLDEPPAVLPRLIQLFDELAAVYPRKDCRLEAQRAWHALALDEQQAAFVVQHVRTRVQAGWVADSGGPRFIPMLWRFLEGRRWLERASVARPAPSASAAPDGFLTMRSCPSGCGEVQEGRLVGGVAVYDACSRCAPAGEARSPGRGTERPA